MQQLTTDCAEVQATFVYKSAANFIIIDDYFLSSPVRKFFCVLSGLWTYGRFTDYVCQQTTKFTHRGNRNFPTSPLRNRFALPIIIYVLNVLAKTHHGYAKIHGQKTSYCSMWLYEEYLESISNILQIHIEKYHAFIFLSNGMFYLATYALVYEWLVEI